MNVQVLIDEVEEAAYAYASEKYSDGAAGPGLDGYSSQTHAAQQWLETALTSLRAALKVQ